MSANCTASRYKLRNEIENAGERFVSVGTLRLTHLIRDADLLFEISRYSNTRIQLQQATRSAGNDSISHDAHSELSDAVGTRINPIRLRIKNQIAVRKGR